MDLLLANLLREVCYRLGFCTSLNHAAYAHTLSRIRAVLQQMGSGARISHKQRVVRSVRKIPLRDVKLNE